jgi:hypothetical protein
MLQPVTLVSHGLVNQRGIRTGQIGNAADSQQGQPGDPVHVAIVFLKHVSGFPDVVI